MEPEAVSLANVGDVGQRVEGAEHCGAGGGGDEERDVALRLVLDDLSLQLAGDEAAALVSLDHDAVVRAEAADGGARLHRVMGLVRGEHDQLPRQALRAVLLVVGEHPVAGGEERVQVGDGAAGRQDRVAAVPSDDLAHLRQHDVLHQDEHRRDFVREHVGVRRRRQPLARHRDDV